MLTKSDIQKFYMLLRNPAAYTPERHERFHAFWAQFPFHELSDGELFELADVTMGHLNEQKYLRRDDFVKTLQNVLFDTLAYAEMDLEKASVWGLTGYLMAFASHRFYPGPAFLRKIKGRLTYEIPVTGAQRLTKICRSFAALNEYPGDIFLETASKKILDSIKDFNAADLAQLSRSYVVFNLQRSTPATKAIAAVMHEIARKKIDAADKRSVSQIFDAAVLLGLPAKYDRIIDTENPSQMEMATERFLVQSGAVRVPNAEYVGELKHTVDLAMEWRRRMFFIEVDGPFHFVTSLEDGTLRLNGNTLLQSALLQKVMPQDRVIRMRGQDIEAITQSEFTVNRFLNMAIALPADVYMTHSQHQGTVSLKSIISKSVAHVIRDYISPVQGSAWPAHSVARPETL